MVGSVVTVKPGRSSGFRPLFAVLGVLLSGGCAPAPVRPPVIEIAPPDAPALGVALVEPASDVADLTAAVRHVLYRAEDRAALGSAAIEPVDDAGDESAEDPGDVDAAAPDAPATVGAARADNAVAGAERLSGLLPGRARHDAIRAAWSRYCVSADLTPAQWGLIARTAMPAVLAAQWADRCRPEG